MFAAKSSHFDYLEVRRMFGLRHNINGKDPNLNTPVT